MVLDVRSGLSQDDSGELCSAEIQRWVGLVNGITNNSQTGRAMEGQCVGKEVISGRGH